MAGVLEEPTPEFIGGIGAADHLEDVLRAVVVDIAECHRVALLQMTESSRGGDVLKELSMGVPEHLVRHDVRERRGSRSDAEVEPSVFYLFASVPSHPY